MFGTRTASLLANPRGRGSGGRTSTALAVLGYLGEAKCPNHLRRRNRKTGQGVVWVRLDGPRRMIPAGRKQRTRRTRTGHSKKTRFVLVPAEAFKVEKVVFYPVLVRAASVNFKSTVCRTRSTLPKWMQLDIYSVYGKPGCATET